MQRERQEAIGQGRRIHAVMSIEVTVQRTRVAPTAQS
jgi:hypothetical protein